MSQPSELAVLMLLLYLWYEIRVKKKDWCGDGARGGGTRRRRSEQVSVRRASRAKNEYVRDGLDEHLLIRDVTRLVHHVVPEGRVDNLNV